MHQNGQEHLRRSRRSTYGEKSCDGRALAGLRICSVMQINANASDKRERAGATGVNHALIAPGAKAFVAFRGQ